MHKGETLCVHSKEQQTLPKILHLRIEMFPRFSTELPRARGSGSLGLDARWEQMFFQNFQRVLFWIKPGIAQEQSFVVAGTSWPQPQSTQEADAE